jgi:hypothetical protein
VAAVAASVNLEYRAWARTSVRDNAGWDSVEECPLSDADPSIRLSLVRSG